MIRGIYTAAAGMAAEIAKQEVVANNLANLATEGFKQNMAVFKARRDQSVVRVEAEGGARASVTGLKRMGDLSTGVYLDEIATQFQQGSMRQTDEPFDLALSGKGFFVVQGPDGEELLSRGGSMTKDAEGYLADARGRRLLTDQGPIQIASKDKVSIDDQGQVRQGKSAKGQLRVVDVDDPLNTIAKRGDTSWSIADPTRVRPVTTPVMQGYLEGSNVNPMREMIELINVQRAYESNQRVVLAQDETLAKAVGDLGRV